MLGILTNWGPGLESFNFEQGVACLISAPSDPAFDLWQWGLRGVGSDAAGSREHGIWSFRCTADTVPPRTSRT